MTRDDAGIGRSNSPDTQDAGIRSGSHGEEEEHHPRPGGPLATPDTAEGREAAEAEGEEA